MKLLVILLFSLLAFGQGTVMPILGSTVAPSGGGGTLTVAQQISCTGMSGAGTGLFDCAISPTAGHTLLIGSGSLGALQTSMTPSAGSTCTLDGSDVVTTSDHLYIWRCPAISGGITKVTLTDDTGNRKAYVEIIEVVTSSPLNAATVTLASRVFSSTWTTLSVTPTAGHVGIIAGFGREESDDTTTMTTSAPWNSATSCTATVWCAVGAYQTSTSTSGAYQPTGIYSPPSTNNLDGITAAWLQ